MAGVRRADVADEGPMAALWEAARTRFEPEWGDVQEGPPDSPHAERWAVCDDAGVVRGWLRCDAAGLGNLDGVLVPVWRYSVAVFPGALGPLAFVGLYLPAVKEIARQHPGCIMTGEVIAGSPHDRLYQRYIAPWRTEQPYGPSGGGLACYRMPSEDFVARLPA